MESLKITMESRDQLLAEYEKTPTLDLMGRILNLTMCVMTDVRSLLNDWQARTKVTRLEVRQKSAEAVKSPASKHAA